ACPEALVLESDRESEYTLFELVAAAVDTIAAGVDVLRPGVLLMAARGPARPPGGEEALAEGLIEAGAGLPGWDCSGGIPDHASRAAAATRAHPPLPRPGPGPAAARVGGTAAGRPRPAPSADWTSPRPSTCCRGWGSPPSATWRPCPPPRSPTASDRIWRPCT